MKPPGSSTVLLAVVAVALGVASTAAPSQASGRQDVPGRQEEPARQVEPARPEQPLTEGRPLHLQIVHLIVNVAEPGLYQVAQVMHVQNTADRPFLGGPTAPDGRRGGLLVPLPADSSPGGEILQVVRQTVQPLPPPDGGLDPAQLVLVDGGLLETRPFPAGTKQVAVTYELVAGEEGVDVALALPYPTQAFSLLVGGPAAEAVRVSAPELASQEPQFIRDTEFRHWTGSALAPGTVVRFSLAPAGRQLDTSTWALLGLALAILAAAGAAWRGGPGPGVQRRRRDELVDEIAHLDREHALGRIEDSEYRLRRGAALEEVLAIDERLEGGNEPAEA